MANDHSTAFNTFGLLNDDMKDDTPAVGSLSSPVRTMCPLGAGHVDAGRHFSPTYEATSDAAIVTKNDGICEVGAIQHMAFELDLSAGLMAGQEPSLTNLSGSTQAFGAVDVLNAPGAAGSIQILANYLTSGFWADRDATSRWFNVSDSGLGANSGTLYYNVTGWTGNLATFYGPEADTNGLTAERQTMVREAFKVYGAVMGIDFVETTSTGDEVDFFFKDADLGQAYEAEQLFSGSGGAIDYAVINVGSDWFSGLSNIGGVNAYTFQTFLHEIGHALGLGHQGAYNAGAGFPTYNTSAQWANDSWQQSIMSYWGQSENTEYADDSNAQLVTPMAVDWIALNTLYAGLGYGTAHAFSGNTVYGVGTNITTTTSTAFANLATYAATNAFTIVDGSGTDTIDFSNFSANQTINLFISTADATHASLSNVGGLIKNMSIAVGVVIENATTGGGDDTIYGNTADNVLTGNSGNDFLDDDAGNDTLYGGSGNDVLNGGADNDRILGGADTDTIHGGAGNDYISAVGPENESAGDLGFGEAGNDTLVSGIGLETLDGGDDIDTIDHTNIAEDYVFDLSTGLTNRGGESFTNFEIVYMGAGNDRVTGSADANEIFGGDGADTLSGGGGTDSIHGDAGDDYFLYVTGEGFDNFYGGTGIDTVEFQPSSALNMVIDLAAGTFAAEGAFLDFFDIERVITSAGADLVSGSLAANDIEGGDGNDWIDGAGGDDVLDGGNGDDSIFGSEGMDHVRGQAGTDLIYGGTDSDTLSGGRGRDDISGGSGGDVLCGGAGADTVDGGDGVDWLDYRGSAAAVAVDLGTGLVSGGQADGDTITSIECVLGSNHDDSLTGDAGNNKLYGLTGDDTLLGGGGQDVLRGGAGADSLNGGDGLDWLDYRASFDGVTVDLATNTVSGGDAEGDVISGFERASGSRFDDVIVGDGGKNILNGIAGNDSLYGGGGNDLLRGGAGADSLKGGDGVDWVSYRSSSDAVSIDLALGTATGGDALGDSISEIENVLGSAYGDRLVGDSGDNVLNGAFGSDTLTGGDGRDSFVFSSQLGASNVDQITDFNASDDAIRLKQTVFVGLTIGALQDSAFVINTTGLAEDVTNRIIFDTSNGNLFFDIDGIGGVASQLFATLTPTAMLSSADFFAF